MSAEDELAKLKQELEDKKKAEEAAAKKKRFDEGDDNEDGPGDTWAPSGFIQFIAGIQSQLASDPDRVRPEALTVSICVWAMGMEITRFVFDAEGLVERNRAALDYTLEAFDAANAECLLYVLAGTSISPQPGGYIAVVIWRISNRAQNRGDCPELNRRSHRPALRRHLHGTDALVDGRCIEELW
jgi:hypothetical protein